MYMGLYRDYIPSFPTNHQQVQRLWRPGALLAAHGQEEALGISEVMAR